MLSAAATAARAQPLPPIHGRVVADDTGDAIRNARVAFVEAADSPVALTDVDGRFTLAPAAEVKRLQVSKTGYATTTFASVTADLRMPKSGAVTGRVLDDLGEPLPLMNVVAERVRREGDRVTFERVTAVETDDLGEYRLFGLPAGEFVIATAPGRIGTQYTSVPVSPERLVLQHYYGPADTPERARPVRVEAGEDVPGIDFTFPLPALEALPLPALPQARPGASAIIRGHFLRENGLPVRRGRVWLASRDGQSPPYQSNTDDQGRYEFRNLLPGGYLLNAMTLGTERAVYGPRGLLGRGSVLTLEAGETADGIDIALRRSAAIGGRVLDEYGDPMQNANVRVERTEFTRDRRRLVPASGVASRQTDDRGRYRIFGLPPGRYLVSAVVGEAVQGQHTAPYPGYARTYFPGTAVPAEAETLELLQGQQSLTFDLALARGRVARLAGTAYASDGELLQGVVSLTQSVRSGALATGVQSVRTGADGRFEFTRLPPGEYVVQAVGARPTIWTEGAFASQFVTIDGADVAGLSLHLAKGSTIEGRLIFDGADPPEDPQFHITPVPADPDLTSLIDNAPARADIHDDGTFEISGLNGPRRLQLTHAPAGWALAAVRANGIDVTDAVLMFGAPDQSLTGVEVVLTTHVSRLTLTCREATARPPGDIRVIVVAADRSLRYSGSRYIAVGAPKPDGTFEFVGLPRGDYYAAAVSQDAFLDTPATDEESLLESFVAGATKITLADGERRSASVRVVER